LIELLDVVVLLSIYVFMFNVFMHKKLQAMCDSHIQSVSLCFTYFLWGSAEDGVLVDEVEVKRGEKITNIAKKCCQLPILIKFNQMIASKKK
jgi:hypothetical protein